MKSSDRRQILWLGSSIPKILREELSKRGMTLLVRIAKTSAVTSHAEASRAVIVEYSGPHKKVVSTLRRLEGAALPHGLAIAVVTRTKSAQLAVQQLSSTPELLPPSRVRVMFDAWSEIAEWIARFEPGPPASSTIHISGRKLPKEHRVLLARSFDDFSKIRIRKVSGGASGAAVYLVTPVVRTAGKQPRSMPFIAKVDEIDRIEQERSKYREFFEESVPFNHRPYLPRERSANGAQIGIMVEDFLDRAVPFVEALKVGNPTVLIGALFDGAFRNWRLCAKKQTWELGDFFTATKVLRKSRSLEEAARNAKRLGHLWMSPADLFLLIKNRHPVNCWTSQTHGDLHCGNIFIAAGSLDPILIDFYKATEGPSVADAACLEVDIAFRHAPAGMTQMVRNLFSWPIRVPTVEFRHEQHSWIWETVRAIRSIGIISVDDQPAYVVAIASYLIRFASFSDNANSDRRALAYSIACRLAKSL